MAEADEIHDPRLNAKHAVENDPIRAWMESNEHQYWLRMHKALMLAPNLETCIALLNGQTVHPDRLDPNQLKRFGLR